MRRVALALLGALIVAGPAIAQSPKSAPVATDARLTLARQMIDLLRLDQMYDAMFVQLAPAFAQAVLGAMATDAASKPLYDTLVARDHGSKDRMIAILSQEFMAAIKRQYPALKDGAAKEYAAAFTEQELRDILAFYSSGAGAKALALMPQLQTQLAVQGQALGRAAGEDAARRAMARIEREMAPRAGSPTS